MVLGRARIDLGRADRGAAGARDHDPQGLAGGRVQRAVELGQELRDSRLQVSLVAERDLRDPVPGVFGHEVGPALAGLGDRQRGLGLHRQLRDLVCLRGLVVCARRLPPRLGIARVTRA